MTDLVPRSTDVDSWVEILGPVGDLSSRIAATEFVPRSLRGRVPAVAAAVLAGRERGLPPMVSLASIDVVDGRPTLSAQLLAALIFRAGHRITVIESSDKAAEVKIERADGLGEAQVRWTMADAQRAGLAGKSNWQKYARQMLYARALSECARMVAPDVALGLDVDLGAPDQSPRPAPTVVQVNPTPTPAVAHREAVEAEEAVLVDPEPTPTPAAPQRAAQPAEEPAEELVTPAQMRKLGALIGDWERREGRKLERDERRRFIGFMAGIAQPDTLGSAKDLTRAQASEAIDQLQAALDEPADGPQADEDGVVIEDLPEGVQ